LDRSRYGTTNKTVFIGNDGGIYKAGDITTVTPTSGWQELNNILGITQFYGVAGNGARVIIGGTQDNGTLQYDPRRSKSDRVLDRDVRRRWRPLCGRSQ
jgi:hypothetical protein